MKSNGSQEPLLLVVGEAPGGEEDYKGVPFVGRSGQLLRQVLGEAGFDEMDIRYTNVVRCRPPENAINKRAIDNCKQFALRDIEKYRPQIVFLIGDSPLSGILGETGITNWNGVKIEKTLVINDKEVTCTFIPLYHPAFILRNSTYMDEWLEAILSSTEISLPKPKTIYKIPHSLFEVKEMQTYLAQYKYISYDIETSSLDAFNKDSILLSVSFAAGDRAYSLPVDHPESWWYDYHNGPGHEDYEAKQVKKIIKKVLLSHNGGLIGHNIKFDLMHTWAQLGIMPEAAGDTMLLSHLIDSRQGIHGLKRLAGVHLGMYDYDEPLELYKKEHPEADPKHGGSYANIPLDILLPYGAMDAEATLNLEGVLYPKLSDKQKVHYHEITIPATNTLCRMQCNGFATDQYIAKRYWIIYAILKGAAMKAIQEDPMVIKMTKAKNRLLEAEWNKKRHNVAYKPWIFNPGSALQLAELYFKYYKIPKVGETATGNPTTSSKALKPLEGKYPILGKIRHYKLLTKAISTYLKPAASGQWTEDDGFVHSTINQHGTKTGRTSSSDPVNLQNIPTPEKEPGTVLESLPIKNIFTHRDWLYDGQIQLPPDELGIFEIIEGMQFDNGALVSADYSGMELRVFASLADCEPMLEIHASGADFHSMVAIMSLEHRQPGEITKEETKRFKKEHEEVRYRYKWTNWTLLYGGDEYTLHNLYDIPLEDAIDTIESYYSVFPEVLQFRQWTQDFAEDHGYIESPFGRREWLPYINDQHDKGNRNKDRRAAVNMPVQSAASDTLLIALVCIDKELIKRGMRSKLVNTVHDSIVGDCPKEEIVTFAKLCVDVMENVDKYAAEYMPNVDFSWLKCGLKADIEIGTHYGAEIGFDEWLEKYGSKES